MILEIDARSFLTAYYSTSPRDLSLIGAGAWSQCFAFTHADRALVIRFGKHVGDFYKDRRAHAYDAPSLPIPEVLDIGPAFDGYYCISSRVVGAPLELVGATQWCTLVPALARAMEALRTADISITTGIGGWNADGQAEFGSWSAFLLSCAVDSPTHRTHGWRQKLDRHAVGAATFDWGYALLQTVATVPAPRCLVHCDLANRNVHVIEDTITGVFDWGCSLFGDHLYELAWFEFWAPWTPSLDMVLLRRQLDYAWRASGYRPDHVAERLRACYLHIGLGHLGYNAFTGNVESLEGTAHRLRALVAI